MLTSKQMTIRKWLSDELQRPVFAEVYSGAVFFLQTRPDGYITYVAHAGRDILNRLAPSIKGIKAERTQYQQHLDSINHKWNSRWGAKGAALNGDFVSGHLIPSDVCKMIDGLLADHVKGRLRSTESDELFFATFLDYSDKGAIPSNQLDKWRKAKEWFLKHAHVRDKSLSSNVHSDVVKHFGVLEDFLYVASESSYRRIKELNEILEEANG